MTEINDFPEPTPIPVSGRDSVYARLQQHILDPSHRHALVYTGHSGIGKSTLLEHFSTVFDDTLLSVLTAFSEQTFASHDELLEQLIQDITQQLADANFSLRRIPEFDDTADMPLATWFRDVYLPEVFNVIRPHRRLVWLVDDAEKLVKLDDTATSYWHNILETHTQFAIVMTFHTDHETLLPELSPLVNPVVAERLHRLSQADTATLIQQYAPGISEALINQIFEATGGHPKLLSRYSQTLKVLRVDHGDEQAFSKTQPLVYKASQDDFRDIWRKLSRDERLVLTAIASLIYDDPLREVTSKRIEAWLVETDYLLDIVTINAALRGLDYLDIVIHRQGESIELATSLMQQWLLEQARLDGTEPQRGQISLRLIVLAMIIVVILIALVLLVPPQYLDNTPAIPTATLSQ